MKEEITWKILCWEDDIKMELYELWWEGVDWTSGGIQ